MFKSRLKMPDYFLSDTHWPENNKGKICFIADTHFGHPKSAKRRGFEDVESHDKHVFECITSSVGNTDELFIVGDVVNHVDSLHYLQRLYRWVGKLNLILGNHDFRHNRDPSISPTIEQYAHYSDNILGITAYKGYWISHCPIHPRELLGNKNIHGHVHYNSMDDDRYINVSAEAIDYTPIRL